MKCTKLHAPRCIVRPVESYTASMIAEIRGPGAGIPEVSRSAFLVALVQALALWALHDSVIHSQWPATAPGWLMASYLLAVAVPLTLLMLWTYRYQRTLWLAAVGIGAFFAVSSWTRFSHIALEGLSVDAEEALAAYLVPAALSWLIALTFLRARLDDGRWRAPYASLFNSAWRNALMLAEAALFTGVFWGLLALAAALFASLGINGLRTLFADPRFIYPATTLAFVTATQIIGQSDRLVEGVLNQLLDLLKWLAPLAGLIVIAFTLTLLPRLPALFGSSERVMDSAILLALVAAVLVLFNAAYRDGESNPPYSRWLQRAFGLVPPLLVVVAATALFSLTVRIQLLGLTPSRVWGLVTALFAVAFAIGYSWAAFAGLPWFGRVPRVNRTLLLALLGTLLASLTPWGDPMRWSIADQRERAADAVDDRSREGALLFLRFDAGLAGRETLAELAAVSAAAARVAALERRERVRSIDPTATTARYARWRGSLQQASGDTPIPEPLESVLRDTYMQEASELDPGQNVPPPQWIALDLESDGRNEYLLVAGAPQGAVPQQRPWWLFVQDEKGSWVIRRRILSRP